MFEVSLQLSRELVTTRKGVFEGAPVEGILANNRLKKFLSVKSTRILRKLAYTS